jgi:hypothetical protein
MVNTKGDPVALVGVPESTPVVPFSVTPGGKLPEVTLNVGAGFPLATTVKVLAWLVAKVALLALVISGGPWMVIVIGLDVTEPAELVITTV